ncbi:MAG: gephyrin-like molybdotransferase Glp [Candidatus Krumholzibacteriia bacterium]
MEWIDVPDAWACIEREVRPLPPETLPLQRAVGRVLARPVRTDREYPPFDRAAMDGFAVRSEDVGGARDGAPVRLEVVGEATPGGAFAGEAGPGTAVRIMTGAPVPPGWDSVVPVERTSGFDTNPVSIHAPVRRRQNVAGRGSERAAGELLYDAGRRLLEPDIGALAMVGAQRIEVGRRPRVAVLATGDELVPADTAPRPTQIRDSNSPMLAALAAAEAAQVVVLGSAPDVRAELDTIVSRGLQADLLVVSGGVSMGAYDFVGEALAAAGVRFHFERVRVQPGKPVAFGSHVAGVVLALPGNPVSALVTFRLFGRTVLRCLQGMKQLRPVWGRAHAAFEWRRRSPKWVLLPGRSVDEGAAVERVPCTGSGDLLAYARASCQIVLPPDLERVAPGDRVWVWPL